MVDKLELLFFSEQHLLIFCIKRILGREKVILDEIKFRIYSNRMEGEVAQMDNYLNNNIVLINMYEKLYANGIKVNDIIQMFREGKFNQYNGFDLGRFRVFIDGCLLLLNREKLDRYYKREYCFAKFIDKVLDDPKLIPYIRYIKNDDLFSEIPDIRLYCSMEGKEKNMWDQVWTIRNSLAHMQYGNFQFQESGQLICYYLYNKDKGVCKDEGVVFEPILHEFIKKFFSNYSYGIPFKNTFFMKYSMKNMRKTLRMRYYEITSFKGVDEIYDGYSENTIAKLIKSVNNKTDILAYLFDNKNKLDIKEYKINEKINERYFRKIANNYGINDMLQYFYGLKTFLDFETEISNFLVHIGQLNEVFYEHYVLTNCGKYSKNQIEEVEPLFEKKLGELREDESAVIAFDIGFTFMKIMNFALRMEDDDYAKLDYSKVDVSMFSYKEESLRKYIIRNKIKEDGAPKYVIERIRNSLMHGNFSIEATSGGEILVIFTDIYYKRSDAIKITLNKLKKFLCQPSLYLGIPNETEVILFWK